MKIKIELNLPFQKLEDYNIETNLDDIIQALPENSSIDKQEILDSILKEGEFHNDYFVLEKNDNSEIILFESDESEFLNILNVLENDKFFYIKKHHHFNIKSGDEYTEISGGERQKTILTGGPYQEYAIANKKEIEKYEASTDADQIKIIDEGPTKYLIKSKDFNYDEWLNKLLGGKKEYVTEYKNDINFEEFYDGEEYTEKEKEDYVGEYYQICENLVHLEYEGEEVDSGYLELTLFSNYVLWESEFTKVKGDKDECRGYDRQEEDSFVMSEMDYDHMELVTEREIDRYSDFGYATHAFNEMVWGYKKEQLMRKFQEELSSLAGENLTPIENENGPNLVYEGAPKYRSGRVYYKFNTVNGKVHGTKEMYGKRNNVGLRDALLMLSNYENGILNGLQITYCPKEYNNLDVPEKIYRIEMFDKGKCVKVQEFTHLNLLYGHLLYSKMYDVIYPDGNEDEPEIIADSEGAKYPLPAHNQKLVNFFNDLALSIFDGSISIKKFKSEITEDEARSKLREVVCYLYPNSCD